MAVKICYTMPLCQLLFADCASERSSSYYLFYDPILFRTMEDDSSIQFTNTRITKIQAVRSTLIHYSNETRTVYDQYNNNNKNNTNFPFVQFGIEVATIIFTKN